MQAERVGNNQDDEGQRQHEVDQGRRLLPTVGRDLAAHSDQTGNAEAYQRQRPKPETMNRYTEQSHSPAASAADEHDCGEHDHGDTGACEQDAHDQLDRIEGRHGHQDSGSRRPAPGTEPASPGGVAPLRPMPGGGHQPRRLHPRSRALGCTNGCTRCHGQQVFVLACRQVRLDWPAASVRPHRCHRHRIHGDQPSVPAEQGGRVDEERRQSVGPSYTTPSDATQLSTRCRCTSRQSRQRGNLWSVENVGRACCCRWPGRFVGSWSRL